MLLELRVSNFAIIENIHIEFGQGLNILTGETGAGKSVLLKSLALLMGLKASTESIRSGFSQASIEGSFNISKRPDIFQRLGEMGIECEDHILLVKRVLSEEKSRVYINGSLSTLNSLRDLVAPLIEVAGQSAPLIEMTGQFENRNLLSKAYHLDLLDQYSSSWEMRNKYSAIYADYHKTKTELHALQNKDQSEAQRLDFLTYQRDEIAKLDLRPNEDIEIELEIRRLKDSSRWMNFLDLTEDALLTGGDSAIDRLGLVTKKAQDFTGQDAELASQIEKLKQAKILIEDGLFEIRKMAEKIDKDPKRLEQLEQRLSDLRKLQKKYGPGVENILAALAEIEREISGLENRDAMIAELQERLQKYQGELEKIAATLHKRRSAAAVLMENSVNAELLDLNMKGVSFHVHIEKLAQLGPSGITEVEFMSRTSAKEPPRPLAKFASGGELSRILLSLKRVVGTSTQPRTYLFDEVDTGVSGTTAEKVGKKLRSIAADQQVICVTHLPQVAAFADAHFFIQKSNKEAGKAKGEIATVSMEVEELTGTKRVSEIARLISGEKISKTSMAHAKELLIEASS